MISSPAALEGSRRPTLQFHPGAGYWIAPDGVAIPVTTHIAAICEAPEVFGLNAVHLRETFARYGEPWASEGNARREIILAVINNSGWIRVRHYRRTGWTVNLPDLHPTVLVRVLAFFEQLFPVGLHLDTIHLDHPSGVIVTTLPELKRAMLTRTDQSSYTGGVGWTFSEEFDPPALFE